MRKGFDTVCIMAKNISRLHYGSDSLEGQARRYFQFEVKLRKKKDMCYKNSTAVLLTQNTHVLKHIQVLNTLDKITAPSMYQ